MQSILLGDADIAVAGGAESMSRAPHIAAQARFGARMGDARLVDTLRRARSSPSRQSMNCSVGGRYALVTMCIGGGQGIAAIFERM
jgi:acetyl-CoA acetyltransferase